MQVLRSEGPGIRAARERKGFMVAKKVFSLALALFAGLALVSFPRAAHAGIPPQKDHVEEGAEKDIQGTVKASGSKVQFVTDGDGKVWDVINPDPLKGHINEHVQINAHLFPSRSSLHVHTVKKLKN